MAKVRMPPIPVVVPVRIMLRHDVVAKVRETLIRLPCNRRTRSWMNCPPEVARAMDGQMKKSAALHLQSLEPGLERAFRQSQHRLRDYQLHLPRVRQHWTRRVETATGDVTATTKSSTYITTVTSRPCYGD